MNEFEKRIKVDTPITLKKTEDKKEKDKEVTEKVVDAVFRGIYKLYEEETDEDKKIKFADHLHNLQRIAKHYQDPEYIDLTLKFFERLKANQRKADEEYWNGRTNNR